MSLITLTTDFGLQDEFVGVMKGVIYSKCPSAQVIDISHGIGAQNITRAAYLISSSFHYFPQGTIHVIVVDPGVGSSRKVVLVKAAGQLFLVPDNGVATLLFPLASEGYEVSNHDLFLVPTSSTFHGRDIFAPVAAHLACGLPVNKVGPLVELESLVRLPLAPPVVNGETLTGKVIDIDHFGNLITNIDYERAGRFCADDFDNVSVYIGSIQIHSISISYSTVPVGEAVALFGSRNFLEIGINQKNAAEKFKLGLDSAVYLRI